MSYGTDFDFDFDHFLRVEMRDHIFGLGLISLQYNTLEHAFKYIMEAYVDYTVSNLLFDKASNEQRANAIKALVKAKEPDTNISDHVNHLLTYFAICSENRNVLMHFSETWAGSPVSAGGLPLRKPLKSGGVHIFQLELTDIKRVLGDIIAGLKYVINVVDLIRARKSGGLTTLLQKPPLPDRLSPHQPLATPLSETPRPQP